MSGSGDRASKSLSPRAPTLSSKAEGHDDAPRRTDVESSCTPGSKSSARCEMPLEREPGDLIDALTSVVDEGQSRQGEQPNSVEVVGEKSDAGMVPKKSTKTRVTPVESMEGRAAAKGKSVARNASPTLRGIDALTFLQRIGQRAKEKPKEKSSSLANRPLCSPLT